MYKITAKRVSILAVYMMLLALSGGMWRSNAARNISAQEVYSDNQGNRTTIVPLVDGAGGPYEMCLFANTANIAAPQLVGAQQGEWKSVSSNPTGFIGTFGNPNNTPSTTFSPDAANPTDKKVVYTISWTVTETGKPTVVSRTTVTVYPNTKIIKEPNSVLTRSGPNVTFSVEAVGKNLIFQWKKNGANIIPSNRIKVIDDPVKGTSILKIFNVNLTDEATYSVDVTGACPTDPTSVVSTDAPLTILSFFESVIESPILYVADTGNNRLQRSGDVGVTWQSTTLTSPNFTLPVGGFSSPEAVGVNMGWNGGVAYWSPNDPSDDIIYVTDTAHNRVVRSFDGGKTWLPFVTIPRPNGIVVSPFGSVTLLDTEAGGLLEDTTKADVFVSTAGAIFMYPEGDITRKKTIATSPTVIDPHGLAIDINGNLYVADKSRGVVLWYSPAQLQAITPIPTILLTSGGNGVSQVSRPEGVGVDEVGNLYVADTGNSRVMMYPVALSGVKPVTISAGKAMISAILPKQPQVQIGEVRNPEGVTVISIPESQAGNRPSAINRIFHTVCFSRCDDRRILVVSDSQGRNLGNGTSTTVQANETIGLNDFDPTNWTSIGQAGSGIAGYFLNPSKIR